MSWKTDQPEPTILDQLSPREREFFSKLSPHGKEAAQKIMQADKKTRAQAAFQLILRLCWDGKDEKINKEQFFDITDTLFNFLWIAATMATMKLVAEDGPKDIAENLVLLQIIGSQEGKANARQLQNLMEMLK
jgi:hypothetical protein